MATPPGKSGSTPFGGVYRGCRVLVTGHTGFKGSWLMLWLDALGADVTGLALAPDTAPNHWDLLRLAPTDHRIDIRDAARVRACVREAKPEIVFHLAAQSLVRRSYADPLETWSTNVSGTANVLDACRDLPGLKAIVVVTSDKCYENNEVPTGYRETDALGGYDPYSASKAGTELVAASYRRSFFGGAGAPALATARAGNVIGGGDWSEDRLIPDIVRAVAANGSVEIRSPGATRPWQHVLETISGYLHLGALLMRDGGTFAEAWNFGPDAGANRTVADVLNAVSNRWPAARWFVSTHPQPHEAHILALDSAKARQRLGWRPVWSFEEAVANTVEWYRAFVEQRAVASRAQLQSYVAAAAAAGLPWCTST